MKSRAIALTGGALSLLVAGAAHAQPAAPGLRAGSARVDITPLASELATLTDSIRDPLFARAIVVASGNSCAVLIGADLTNVRNDVIALAVPRIVAATGCPEANIVISATHTHSSNTAGLGIGAPLAAKVADGMVLAATRAKASLRPATMGYGTTQLSLNVNRDLYTRGGAWKQAPNPDGPSDKTLAVVDFIGEDHVPIGVYLNYAMHPINFYLTGVISADFPGVASRAIEDLYDGKAVAIFSQGASGDQNPAYSERGAASRIRTGQGVQIETIGAPPPPPSTSRNTNTDQTNAMKNPAPAGDMAAYRRALAVDGSRTDAMGVLIAQAALNTMRDETRRTATGPIWGGQRAFTCPGRDRLDIDNPVRENAMPGYKDGAPVNLKVGVLRIGEVNFVSVNGEVYSQIAERLKAASPAAKTFMVTLANGAANSGYIYADDAYSHLSFQVIGSRLKPGCAENEIIRSALDLTGQAWR
jgi:hypothetical protein